MTNFGDTVYACECSCGVTFDFRSTAGREHGFCPRCGRTCPVRAWWEADDGGYHVSRQVIVGLAQMVTEKYRAACKVCECKHR